MTWIGEFDVFDGEFQLERSRAAGAAAAASDEWVRNKAWPTLVEPAESTEEVVGLFAVFPGDENGINKTFRVLCQGSYTVDVGDGSAPIDTASNNFTAYDYDFDNANLYDATVTLTDSGDLVTRNAHGYGNGDVVRFYRIVSTTGITEGQDYYVINATTNTFQVSATEGGSAVALTTDGSAALLPYKIATVSITPQAGQNLTVIQLDTSQGGWTGGATANWLEVVIRAPNCTSLPAAGGSSDSRLRMCERFAILEHNATSFASLCNGMISLQKFEVNSTAGVTDFSSMFSACYALRTVPLFDTSSATNVSRMFEACVTLRTVPLFDTSSATNVSSMFTSCVALREIPLFDLSSATNLTGLLGCPLLTEIPALVFRSDATGDPSFKTGCIQRYRATGPYVSFNISQNALSSAALDEIYTNLPVVVGQTITVSQNPGTSGDDPSIATAKGWTVTG